MKVTEVRSLALPEVTVIRFGRFMDHRGYFTEHFRRSDFDTHPGLSALKNVPFLQMNESFSLTDTIRGLHFQWNPYVGKLIRTVRGRMIDLVMDIRRGSPNYGKVIGHDMPANPSMDYAEWIWVPPGFAHGNFFTEETVIEYLCTGEYNPSCEAGISPTAPDLDWSLCVPAIRTLFQQVAARTERISPKDRDGLTLAAWTGDPRANHFIYAKASGAA
jgi:dTDP-4-dehydrorhamnose 3,5-epimerase